MSTRRGLLQTLGLAPLVALLRGTEVEAAPVDAEEAWGTIDVDASEWIDPWADPDPSSLWLPDIVPYHRDRFVVEGNTIIDTGWYDAAMPARKIMTAVMDGYDCVTEDLDGGPAWRVRCTMFPRTIMTEHGPIVDLEEIALLRDALPIDEPASEA